MSERASLGLDVLSLEAANERLRRELWRTAEVAAEERRVRLQLAEALERAAFVSERLMQMIPPEVWRDSGGDDGQGHYEGHYYARQTQKEIEAWAALAASAALDGEEEA